MTDTEILDWFDQNDIGMRFMVVDSTGMEVLVDQGNIRESMLTIITLKGHALPVDSVERVH